MRRTLDLDALRAADARILVDPLWGSGAGWISRLLAGGRIEVVELHTERNPYFGGVNPEPIRPHVDEALRLVAAGGFDLGLLLDGDADRAGADRRARASSCTSSRCTACSCTTWPSIAGSARRS